ncbi:MAG TPA: MFS transporter [Candidatus Limnocylindrales bacterium]|jgi:MFS family permease|nr:MFS transporter [Candidatus Limnocylindrales bacterium]
MHQRDITLLFAARSVRMFGYGLLAVVLVLYLDSIGLSGGEIGLLLALTLLGDAAISLWLTTHADRIGRRRVLIAGAILLLLAGIVFASTPVFVVLLVAATIGVISPSGNEIGPFLAIEQASLTQLVHPTSRTSLFARYQLVGSIATALGSLAAGFIGQLAVGRVGAPEDAYRAVIMVYAAIGIVLAVLFAGVSPAVEVPKTDAIDPTIRSRLGLHRSQGVVLRLSMLFALDAFAGGFVMQSFIAFWFNQKFGVDPALLGGIMFAANILAAASALAAGPLAARFGLVRTMVYTHLPSNVLLILVPLMPTLPLAILVLLARFSISQMDVPTRQSYTMAIVEPDERSAAAGVTGIARSLGVAASPLIAAPLFVGSAFIGAPFVISGTLKIVYDILLYRRFQALRPPEEQP